VKDPESPNPPRLPSLPNQNLNGRCFSSYTPKNVISTEAAHGIIVSSAAEKSASQPRLSPCHPHLPLSVLPTKHRSPGAPSIAHFAMGEIVKILNSHNAVALAVVLLCEVPASIDRDQTPERSRGERSTSFYCRSLCRYFSFAIFRPKNACQAHEPPKALPSNNIHVAF
jgi:hypothetical protein